jgi:four helix bundle protein
MASIRRFEDLICWQRARQLTNFIYKATKNSSFSKDNGLKSQIQRAAVSVMSNIAEGFDRGTKTELINFLFIAKGSCGEVKCQLYVAWDGKYIAAPEFKEGYRLAEETSRLLQSFIKKVKIGSYSGLQHKIEKGKDMVKETLKEFPDLYKKFYPEG